MCSLLNPVDCCDVCRGKKVTQRLNSGGQKGQQDRSLSSPLEPSQELRKRLVG